MMLGMNLPQSFLRDMRVDLGGSDVRMTQQQLHHAQVCAVVEEMCCKGMAEGMG